MVRVLAVLATVLALAACAGGSAKPAAEIAFTVNSAGWGEIWLMRPDGSNRRRLTLPARHGRAAGARTPAWSPGGRQLAYAYGTSDTERATNIYVMQADGKNMRRITTNEGADADPSWSPDGKRISFARFLALAKTAHRGIVVTTADGRGEVQITDVAGSTFDTAPAWSPDGSAIAFTRTTITTDFEHAKVVLSIVGPDGSGLRKLIDGGGEPAWSPDGKRIAFTSVRDRFGRSCFQECTRSGEIYVADAGGGNQRRLTHSKADDRAPTWSPDGRFIAFVSDRSDPGLHDNEIYVMRADGSDLHRITRTGDWNLDPAWRPRRAG